MRSTATTWIGKVRVRADTEQRTALQLSTAGTLERLDWHLNGCPPSAILVVKHLSDPLPGVFDPLQGVLAIDRSWERAVKQRLDAFYRDAVRPDRGFIPPDALAVVFEDRSELLACLALDVAMNSVWQKWWWKMPVREITAGQQNVDVETVLSAESTLVPAILHHLVQWQEAERVLQSLSAEQTRQVLNAVGTAFSVHGLQEKLERLEDIDVASPAPAGDHPNQGAAFSFTRLERERGLHFLSGSTLPPLQHLLLRIGLKLYLSPGSGPTLDFAPALSEDKTQVPSTDVPTIQFVNPEVATLKQESPQSTGISKTEKNTLTGQVHATPPKHEPVEPSVDHQSNTTSEQFTERADGIGRVHRQEAFSSQTNIPGAEEQDQGFSAAERTNAVERTNARVAEAFEKDVQVDGPVDVSSENSRSETQQGGAEEAPAIHQDLASTTRNDVVDVVEPENSTDAQNDDAGIAERREAPEANTEVSQLNTRRKNMKLGAAGEEITGTTQIPDFASHAADPDVAENNKTKEDAVNSPPASESRGQTSQEASISSQVSSSEHKEPGFSERQDNKHHHSQVSDGPKADVPHEPFDAFSAYSAFSFHSELCGGLYLLNLASYLNLLEHLKEIFGIQGELRPWAVMEVLLRALMPADRDVAVEDPLWDMFAFLDGRSPGIVPKWESHNPPSQLQLPAKWLDSMDIGINELVPVSLSGKFVNELDPVVLDGLALVMPFLRYRMCKALGIEQVSANELAETLLFCAGTIYVSSSHVDVVMPLDAVSFPLRLSGLDRDPGWQPMFGRVILFHYT